MGKWVKWYFEFVGKWFYQAATAATKLFSSYRKNTKKNTTKTQTKIPQKHKLKCRKNTK